MTRSGVTRVRDIGVEELVVLDEYALGESVLEVFSFEHAVFEETIQDLDFDSDPENKLLDIRGLGWRT